MSEHPNPPTKNSLPSPRAPVMDFSIAGNDADPAVWDWGNLLDFALDGGDDDPLIPSWLPSPSLPLPPPPPPTVVGSSGVRKRDPRLVCENYLAGRVPCSCPEMDEMDLEEDDDEVVAGERKKRPKPTTTTATITVRCQVPTCEADIAELKGYHRRRRICLRCANASSVVLDGDHKRYCQQCGKFHILPDFDEGKRSCRRKLERHNKRRRRRPNGGKNMVEHENETQGDFLAETAFDGEPRKEQENGFVRGTVETVVSNKTMDRNILESEDTPGSPISSLPKFQNDQSNNTVSFTASGIDQVDERVDNMKSVHSSTFCGNKNVYSSVCPTGRISFKLYDWNPAEFPRRLRHQIFEWLSSMPVELEGYIRPGCTILTMFIAMPRFMWEKLYQDVDLYVKDLINAPESLLLGRADFLIYINNQILQILKDGALLMNIKMKESAPRLHYVYPTYFEAGKPMQFVACGSNLDQPRLRFLVSFSGRYLVCNSCHARSHGKIGLCDENGGNSDHEIFRIDITHTDLNFFGPAFIEVENQSGLSNFVPVLLGSELICSELERISKSPVSNSIMSQCALGDVTPGLCEIFVSEQGAMSELLLDIAWLLKDLRLEKEEFDLSWTNIQRLTRLLQFSIQNGFVNVREMIRRYLDKTEWVGFQKPITLYTDSELLVKFMSHRQEDLGHKSLHDLPSRFDPRDSSDRLLMPQSFSNSEIIFTVCPTNQEEETIPLISKAVDHSRWLSLKTGNEWSRGSHRRSIGTRLTVFAAVSACVVMCFGACVVLLHPREFVVTLRRCLFGGPPPMT